MTRNSTRALALALGLLPLAGCALLTKADPLDPTYYSPESDAAPKPTTPTGQLLRLRRVSGADHLDVNLVVRTAAHEYRLDESRRWTQPPADYLRRALAAELYERRGFVRAVAGDAPELEVDLIAFEDSQAPTSAARIQLSYRLIKDTRAAKEETFTITVPVPGEPDDEARPAKLAKAMGEALTQAVSHVGASVTQALAGS